MGMLGVALASMLLGLVAGHGRLIDPAARNSMWRYGFSNPPNYNDNELFCGGFQNQKTLGGKCGVCGDPYQGPRPHEAGGKYANGISAKTYKQGQVAEVKVELTTGHLGWMEFRLCKWDNPTKVITKDCLDKNVLQLADGSGTRVPIDNTKRFITARLQLPKHITCTQCVMQWYYHAGNNWGCESNGRCCKGCGPQEEFKNCADIAIVGDSSVTQDPEVATRTESSTTAKASTKAKVSTTTPPTAKPTRPTPIVSTTPIVRPSPRTGCRAAEGPFRNQPGLDKYCEINCARGHCPATHCVC
ncbi:unnamed protein product [Owenia fusiformis]|uniref:Uncharacterized protein n=1 Tax=Owenia fusiformis TaxID=6347 RepID=A0A8J1XZD4_OWEFU|nr:unnamed protein product [Owenia fusiformis]